ncbi:MAG TPA: hypothetical protein DDZ04_02595, partial [Parabacteroides sp.]|nr:hypothetical protein [Parabacteroides sp.]
MMMLIFVLGGTTAKAQYFDDIYYSSKKKAANKEVSDKETRLSHHEDEQSEGVEPTLTSSYTRSGSTYTDYDRSVDEYNRRYSSDEEWHDNDNYQDGQKTKVTVKPERRSDLEYSERIVRYHSPSKISIVGADQVDLFVNDGYYSYDYGTDYSDGSANVSVNINMGSPWYSWGGWYDPWFYRPWGGYYSSWWYRPYSWGWGGWYAGWYDPWYDPWW